MFFLSGVPSLLVTQREMPVKRLGTIPMMNRMQALVLGFLVVDPPPRRDV